MIWALSITNYCAEPLASTAIRGKKKERKSVRERKSVKNRKRVSDRKRVLALKLAMSLPVTENASAESN
jgi:hypothetical protein